MTEKISSIEKKENFPEAETMTGDQLFELIYKGDSLPQDSRFLSLDKGGVFKYFVIQNLINIHKKRENFFYPIIKVDDKIVAICELEKSPYEENLLWITGVSVDPAYQDKRYASMVLEETFRFAKETGVALLGSQYSEKGLIKLKSVCHRLADKYGVEFRESDRQ